MGVRGFKFKSFGFRVLGTDPHQPACVAKVLRSTNVERWRTGEEVPIEVEQRAQIRAESLKPFNPHTRIP